MTRLRFTFIQVVSFVGALVTTLGVAVGAANCVYDKTAALAVSEGKATREFLGSRLEAFSAVQTERDRNQDVRHNESTARLEEWIMAIDDRQKDVRERLKAVEAK